MKLLALDLGTKTGWALNSPDISGVRDFSIKRGESPGIKFLRFKGWLKEMLNTAHPDIVVFEQAHHRGGAATAVAYGFQAHLLSWCAEYGVEHLACHTGTLKKFATGKGNASKKAMMRAYSENFGREPIDDNECDARWLLEWAMTELGLK